MEEQSIQEQITAINKKLDVIIENVELQQRKREEMDDLLKDINLVGKDAFQQSVILLDKAQVELDSGVISGLLIKVLQNIGTFYEMMEMMESARDFMKDVSPILHQVGLDAVNKMNELEQKGIFDSLGGIMRNLADPELLAAMNSMTRALATVKTDEKTDDKSLWQIFMQLRSPEIRRSISYSLRLLQAMNKK